MSLREKTKSYIWQCGYPISSTETALAFFESVVCGPMIAMWAFHGVIVKHLLRQQVSGIAGIFLNQTHIIFNNIFCSQLLWYVGSLEGAKPRKHQSLFLWVANWPTYLQIRSLSPLFPLKNWLDFWISDNLRGNKESCKRVQSVAGWQWEHIKGLYDR